MMVMMKKQKRQSKAILSFKFQVSVYLLTTFHGGNNKLLYLTSECWLTLTDCKLACSLQMVHCTMFFEIDNQVPSTTDVS